MRLLVDSGEGFSIVLCVSSKTNRTAVECVVASEEEKISERKIGSGILDKSIQIQFSSQGLCASLILDKQNNLLQSSVTNFM